MTKKYLPLTVSLATLALVAFFIWHMQNKVDRIVVVDVIHVFNNFKMKKELEARVENEINKFSAHIDSMEALLQIARGQNDTKRVEIMSNEIHAIRSEVQSAYEISNKNINEQVWDRLNPLIDQFAKEQGYRIVIGANGMGSVLYNAEAVDRTKEITDFINKKYETAN